MQARLARRSRTTTLAAALLVGLALSGCTGDAVALDPEVAHVQAGAPGEPSTRLTEAPADIAIGSSFSEADVAFLADMNAHHAQALEMTGLVDDRAPDAGELRLFTDRMHLAQTSEIELAEGWLTEHDAAVKRAGGHGGDHGSGHGDDHASMPGMMTAAEMDALKAARGEAFVRLFLVGMVKHHSGALEMVDQYVAQGEGKDARVDRFAQDIAADQSIELERMRRMWQALPKV